MTIPSDTGNTGASTPTLRDLAVQAATQANLNSFAMAYPSDPDQAARITETLATSCPSLTRLINICDSGLVKQLVFYKRTTNAIAVLSCPHPATHPVTNENLIAGSLGDALDIICPVTIGMPDVKGHVITIATSKTTATDTLRMAVSTSDPLSEEGPAPADGTEAEPAGPDRIFIEVNDPAVTPCFAMFPKVFPLTGGYHAIPPAPATGATTPPAPSAPTGFELWQAAISYGIQRLQDRSIHDHDTLFDYDKIEKAAFEASDRDLAATFTTAVTYLTPDDPLYHTVTRHALLEKERAVITYGSKSVPQTPPRPSPGPNPVATATATSSPTTVTDMTTIIEGLSKAITNSKSMTGTERERATEAEEVVSFYEILLASVHDALQTDGTTKSTLVKATLNPLFVKCVLQANKNSKATKAMQDIIEETIAQLSSEDNRFAAACNLIPRMFDQPLVAAIRSGMWEHQHTVLNPDGIKTHFGLHHIAPPRTWSILYKTRMEGEMMLVRQEQVDEDKSRLQAKTTDLYHMGKMGSLADINELLGNFFGLLNAIATFSANNPPAIWLEILAFEKIIRTREGKQWFDLHRNLREVPFNVVQDIQSTLAGFAAEARKPGYRTAVSAGILISPKIFYLAQQQGIELRRTLQNTVLTMAAGHYNLVPLTYKFFQPEQIRDSTRKRDASTAATTDSPHPASRQRPNPATTNAPRTNPDATHRSPTAASPASPSTTQQATAGKTVLKIIGEQNIKMPHPGPIFAHPTKPNQFTLMCCRSAYDGKQCPLNPCNFFHFPQNLSSVSNATKAKLQKWVGEQDNVTWAPAATTWGTSSSTSTAGN
jgi:hypothetical protein